MNAIDLLKQQHAQAKDLYIQYCQSDDADEKQALFDEIADNLAAHSIVEEQLFYPMAFAGRPRPKLDAVFAEHMAMKRELAELIANVPEDADFERRLEALFDLVALHVEQEESQLLPYVAEQLTPEENERLGAEMERKFDELMNEAPSETLPSNGVALAR
jgi:hypothetical protein